MKLLQEGTEALKQNEYFLAFALTDSAEKYSPAIADVPFFRGRILSEVGLFEQAEKAYRKALALNPQYRGIWHNLANNLYRQRQYSQAIKHYVKALDVKATAPTWRGLGRAYVEIGKADSARYAFQQAIKLDSLYGPVYFNFALLEEDEGRLDEALSYVRRALALEPDNVEYKYLAGSYLVKKGKFEAAIPYLRSVLAKHPWNPGAHYNLGQAAAGLGRLQEAKEHFKRSEKMRAQNAKIDLLQDALSRSKNPYSYFALGIALRRAHRYDEAMRAYKVGLYLDPKNIEIRNNIAILHLIRKDTTGAINELKAILEQDASLVDIWVNLGTLYALKKQTARAKEAWLTALQYDPGNDQAKSNLFKLYNSGRPE